jgi:hypothetical protein
MVNSKDDEAADKEIRKTASAMVEDTGCQRRLLPDLRHAQAVNASWRRMRSTKPL